MTKRVAEKELHQLPALEPEYLGLKWGGYNKMPEPYKEITIDEFMVGVHSNHYALCGRGHGQVYSNDWSGYWSANYYFFPYNAYAVFQEYTFDKDRELKRHPNKLKDAAFFEDGYVGFRGGVGGRFMRFFKIGCDHKWVELSIAEAKERGQSHYGNCYHVNECSKCKQIMAYDSSD